MTTTEVTQSSDAAELEYRIIAFNDATGRIDVEFDYGILTASMMLPIDENGNVPTGDVLKSFILQFAPMWEIQRLRALKKNPSATIANAAAIRQLVEFSANLSDPILDGDLDGAKQYAINMLNGNVGKIRARYITNVSGQDLSYVYKSLQALAYKQNNYEGDVPSYILYEAKAREMDPKAVTDAILAKHAQWVTGENPLDPQLEGIRIAGIRKIRQATTNQEVNDQLQAAGQELQKIEFAVMAA